MTRRNPAKAAAPAKKIAPPAPAQPSAPAPAAELPTTEPLDVAVRLELSRAVREVLELPTTEPLDVAALVADCEAQRDRLLRDVFALNADQLEHLAYCTRQLETHGAPPS